MRNASNNNDTIYIESITSPNVFSVNIPDSELCSSSALTFTQSGSDNGIKYELFNIDDPENPSSILETIGNGEPLEWTISDPDVAETTYEIRATDETGACTTDFPIFEINYLEEPNVPELSSNSYNFV